jgi:4-hydroxybenzoate polyprenyltransferase
MFKELLIAMRPKQWLKNVLLFAALVFDQKLLDWGSLSRTIAGFVAFSLGASAIYLINDIADLEQDKLHPKKRNRPLPAGRLSISTAWIATAILLLITLPLAFWLDIYFGLILVTYLVINMLYSYWLKHVAIIDVLTLSSGFVLRVAAGVMLITVQRFSPWLYVCTTLGSLLIGLGKRRAELVMLAEHANSHRRVLDGYTLPFLDQLITIVSSMTIVAYSLYTFSAENLPPNHTMMLTIPFVIYGIFRYLYLIKVENLGGAPEEIALDDVPLLSTALLWGFASIAVLYLGT